MTPRQAGELLTLMRGTWPRLAPDEVANQLWLNDLTRCDSAPALDAFRGLRDHTDRAPSWATFREAYNSALRRHQPHQPAIEAAPPDPDKLAKIIADARAHLTPRVGR